MSVVAKDKTRGELEDAVEAHLAGIARALVEAPERGRKPSPDALKAAYDYQPAYFGGKFPALGVGVTATRGSSRTLDNPNRPAQIEAQVYVFDVSMPMRGARNPGEDRQGTARKRTRAVRDRFLLLLTSDSELGPYTEIVESRGGDTTEVGEPITDEGGERGNLLWLDRTDLVVRIP